MPCKQVSTLTDLCLRNVAANVVWHSVQFANSESVKNCDNEVYWLYKKIQRLFSDSIIGELRNMYCAEQRKRIRDDVKTWILFLFEGTICNDYSSNAILLNCRKFLFNEHRTNASLEFRAVQDVNEEYLEALSSCQNLRSLVLQSCNFPEEMLHLRLQCWHSLRKLDLLLSSCSDWLIKKVLMSCPNLEILKASGKSVTNDCLFYLCKENHEYCFNSQTFRFCPLKGMCCELGKNLKKLTLCGTQITESGVASALQHLPLLSGFIDGGLRKADKDRHFLALGICELKNACTLNEQPPPSLKLTVLLNDDFGIKNFLDLLDCCRSCNTLSSCGTKDVWHFAKTYKRKYAVYGLSNPYDCIVSLSFIVKCLKEPMECFFIEGPRFRIVDHENAGNVVQPSTYTRDLEQIHLCDILCMNESVLRFFTNLLSDAVNVKFLTVSGRIAEEAFVAAMEKNTFRRLEVLSVQDADLKKISLQCLVVSKTNLKKVTHSRCKNFISFITEHQDIAHKNNFHLDITRAEEIVSHFSLMKLHVI